MFRFVSSHSSPTLTSLESKGEGEGEGERREWYTPSVRYVWNQGIEGSRAACVVLWWLVFVYPTASSMVAGCFRANTLVVGLVGKSTCNFGDEAGDTPELWGVITNDAAGIPFRFAMELVRRAAVLVA